MKQITCLLAILFMLTFVGCGKQETNSPVENEADQTTSVQVETETEEEKNIEKEKETEKKEEEVKPQPTPEPQEKPAPQPQETPAPQPAPEPEKPAAPPVDTRNLETIMQEIMVGVSELPQLMTMELDASNFSEFAFADMIEGAEGFVSEPMMGSVAHSVVLVRLPQGTDVQAYANQMKSQADPRKWICVEAEKVQVTTKGNLVLLVMSREDVVETLTNNFLNK